MKQILFENDNQKSKGKSFNAEGAEVAEEDKRQKL